MDAVRRRINISAALNGGRLCAVDGDLIGQRIAVRVGEQAVKIERPCIAQRDLLANRSGFTREDGTRVRADEHQIITGCEGIFAIRLVLDFLRDGDGVSYTVIICHFQENIVVQLYADGRAGAGSGSGLTGAELVALTRGGDDVLVHADRDETRGGFAVCNAQRIIRRDGHGLDGNIALFRAGVAIGNAVHAADREIGDRRPARGHHGAERKRYVIGFCYAGITVAAAFHRHNAFGGTVGLVCIGRAPRTIELHFGVDVLFVRILEIIAGLERQRRAEGNFKGVSVLHARLAYGPMVLLYRELCRVIHIRAVGVGRADGDGAFAHFVFAGRIARLVRAGIECAELLIKVVLIGKGERIVPILVGKYLGKVGPPMGLTTAHPEIAGGLLRICRLQKIGLMVGDLLAGNSQRVGVGPDEGRPVLGVELQLVRSGLFKRPRKGNSAGLTEAEEFLLRSVDGIIKRLSRTSRILENRVHAETECLAGSDLGCAGFLQLNGFLVGVQSNGVGFIGIGLAVVRGELQRHVSRSAYVAVFFRCFHRVGAVDGDLIGQRVTVRVGKNCGEIKLPGNVFKAVLFDALFHALRQRRRGVGFVAAAVVGFDRQGDGLLVSLRRDVLRCRSGGGGVSLCGERCGGQKPENHQRGQQKGQ